VTFKAISLHQPWANMIADGEKTIETRCWPTAHRGDLLICSTRKLVLDHAGQFCKPRGCAVALVNLDDCRPMTSNDEALAGCSGYAGAYAWLLSNIRRIVPFPVRGRHRLYDVSVDRLLIVEASS
jgi:hypothetical protein